MDYKKKVGALPLPLLGCCHAYVCVHTGVSGMGLLVSVGEPACAFPLDLYCCTVCGCSTAHLAITHAPVCLALPIMAWRGLVWSGVQGLAEAAKRNFVKSRKYFRAQAIQTPSDASVWVRLRCRHCCQAQHVLACRPVAVPNVRHQHHALRGSNSTTLAIRCVSYLRVVSYFTHTHMHTHMAELVVNVPVRRPVWRRVFWRTVVYAPLLLVACSVGSFGCFTLVVMLVAYGIEGLAWWCPAGVFSGVFTCHRAAQHWPVTVRRM